MSLNNLLTPHPRCIMCITCVSFNTPEFIPLDCLLKQKASQLTLSLCLVLQLVVLQGFFFFAFCFLGMWWLVEFIILCRFYVFTAFCVTFCYL